MREHRGTLANSEGRGIVGVATDFVCLLHASHFFWSDLGIFLDNVSCPRWCGARRGWRGKEREKEQEKEKGNKEISKVRGKHKQKRKREKVEGERNVGKGGSEKGETED